MVCGGGVARYNGPATASSTQAEFLRGVQRRSSNRPCTRTAYRVGYFSDFWCRIHHINVIQGRFILDFVTMLAVDARMLEDFFTKRFIDYRVIQDSGTNLVVDT